MKAWVCRRYGSPDVLVLADVSTPEPRRGEIRVRVRAVAVTSADARIRSMNLPRGFGLPGRLIFGIARPRQPVLGSSFAGTVDAIGPGTRRFTIGQDVFGINGVRMGAYAERMCISEQAAIALVPRGLSFEAAAALPFGGTTALDYLRRAGIGKDETILINGATGAVGTALVQLARHAGARVVAVCSGANADLVRSLGADRVIDYARHDLRQVAERYDVIADTVGLTSFSAYRAMLTRRGRLLLIAADLPALLLAPLRSRRCGIRVVAGPATERCEDVEMLGRLCIEGAILPAINRVIPFSEIPNAHRLIDTGRKRGNVVAVL